MFTKTMQALHHLMRNILFKRDVDLSRDFSAEYTHGHFLELTFGEFLLEIGIKIAIPLPGTVGCQLEGGKAELRHLLFSAAELTRLEDARGNASVKYHTFNGREAMNVSDSYQQSSRQNRNDFLMVVR